ncbi:MAG: ABC transporter ATP-binding protein [Nevskiales bacterium]
MPEAQRDETLADLMAASPTIMEVAGVGKTFRTHTGSIVIALSPTDIRVAKGEFLSIVGPSGCGKTTLLNIMAGLTAPSIGAIRFPGHPGPGTPHIGFVFQRPVLLPWRRVIDNVLLPAEVMRLTPRATYEQRAHELLAMVGLTEFESAYPGELSGGMQQRTAIVRSLVYDNPVLLMDEPFAALDAMTREELNLELLRIWQMSGRSIVFVTHNIPEAVLMSDRVAVMTARPGQVRDIVTVDLPRPRALSLLGDSRFGELVEQIRDLLRAGHA